MSSENKRTYKTGQVIVDLHSLDNDWPMEDCVARIIEYTSKNRYRVRYEKLQGGKVIYRDLIPNQISVYQPNKTVIDDEDINGTDKLNNSTDNTNNRSNRTDNNDKPDNDNDNDNRSNSATDNDKDNSDNNSNLDNDNDKLDSDEDDNNPKHDIELQNLSKTPVTEPTSLSELLDAMPSMRNRYVRTLGNRLSLDQLFYAAARMNCKIMLDSGYSVFDALKCTKKHQSSQGWKCDYCTTICQTGPKLSEHLKSHASHRYAVMCPKCELIVNFQKQKINDHIKNHQRKKMPTETMTVAERKSLRNYAESKRKLQAADRKTKQKEHKKNQKRKSKSS